MFDENNLSINTPEQNLHLCVCAVESNHYSQEIPDIDFNINSLREGLMKKVGNVVLIENNCQTTYSVYISIFFKLYEGKLIALYDATSVIVDWRLIDKYIEEICGLKSFGDLYSAISYIDDLNKIDFNNSCSVLSALIGDKEGAKAYRNNVNSKKNLGGLSHD